MHSEVMDKLLTLFIEDPNNKTKKNELFNIHEKEIDDIINAQETKGFDEAVNASYTKNFNKLNSLMDKANNPISLIFKYCQKIYDEFLSNGILYNQEIYNDVILDEIPPIDDIYIVKYNHDKLSNVISKTDYVNYKYSNIEYYCNYINNLDGKIKCYDITKITHTAIFENHYTKIIKNLDFLKQIVECGGYFTSSFLFYGTDAINVAHAVVQEQSYSILKLLNSKFVDALIFELKKDFQIKNDILSTMSPEDAYDFKKYSRMLKIFQHHLKSTSTTTLMSKELFDSFNKEYHKVYKTPISVLKKYTELRRIIKQSDNHKPIQKLDKSLDDLEKYYIGIGTWYYSHGYIVIYTLTHIVSVPHIPYNKMLDNTYLIEPFLFQKQHPNYNKLLECYVNVKDHLFIPMFSFASTKQFNKIKKSLHYQNSYLLSISSTKPSNYEDTLLLDEIKTNIKKTRKPKKKNKNKNRVIELETATNNDAIIDISNEPESEGEDEPELDETELNRIAEVIKNDIEKDIEKEQNVLTTKQNHFEISFNYYEYFQDKSYIRYLIYDCYINNEKFNNFMGDYTHIRVKKDIHTDLNGLEKSNHFNIVFFNKDFNEMSKQYHAYIYNNSITSITRIESII